MTGQKYETHALKLFDGSHLILYKTARMRYNDI